MLNVEITIEGKTWGDVELALDEAKRRLMQETYLGFDENEDGSFHYEVEGEEESDEEEEEGDDA